ncbi:DJ-1/PfpI family protein [Vallitalea okinawensis]|uniref:DJ-1/PfpI family protein n=1 Tax=Vallitalea okinawensis TaxID=2078660 RepID=UPI000CFDC36D|nr:DJ-1/PfpI family protein [Vallitalea okinawensis]
MKNILFFLYEDMADFEVTLVAHILGAGGEEAYKITPIAYTLDPIRSKCGLVYLPEKTVDEVLDQETEGLIIPGGFNMDARPHLITLIQKLYKEKKLVSAICAAPYYLAKAGILDHHRFATSLANWSDDHKALYGEDPFPRENYVNDRVMIDKNVITAKGVAFIDFAIAITKYLKLYSDEDIEEYKKILKG